MKADVFKQPVVVVVVVEVAVMYICGFIALGYRVFFILYGVNDSK